MNLCNVSRMSSMMARWDKRVYCIDESNAIVQKKKVEYNLLKSKLISVTVEGHQHCSSKACNRQLCRSRSDSRAYFVGAPCHHVDTCHSVRPYSTFQYVLTGREVTEKEMLTSRIAYTLPSRGNHVLAERGVTPCASGVSTSRLRSRHMLVAWS